MTEYEKSLLQITLKGKQKMVDGSKKHEDEDDQRSVDTDEVLENINSICSIMKATPDNTKS